MNDLATSREGLLNSLATLAYKKAPPGCKFRLSSGEKSSVVIDASLAIRDSSSFLALTQCLESIIPGNLDFDVVAGPSSGADPLCAAMMLTRRNLRWCSVRKEKKGHGFDTGLITGPIEEGDRVFLLEDVLTTGRSLSLAVEAIKKAGCTIVGAVVLVDRGEFGGKDKIKKMIGPAQLYSIFKLAEVRNRHKELMK